MRIYKTNGDSMIKNRLVVSPLEYLVLVISIFIAQNALAEYIPPISYIKASEVVKVNPNGSYELVVEALIQIDTHLGVESNGQHDISYNSKQERVQIIDAYTLQKDGRKVKVLKDGFRESADPISSGAPMFSETKHKIIIYPEVKVGSRLYYKYKSIQHTPLFKGQFIFSSYFTPHYKFKDYEVNLDIPNKFPIQVEAKGVEGGLIKERNGRKYYRYVFNQQSVYPMEYAEVDTDDFAPYVIASSFKSHVEFGKAYEKGVASKMRVTPEIKKLADELTLDISEPKAQVEVIYNWVSKNIRYVAVYLGNGGVVPHDVNTILKNHYGDCKDHSVILSALLKAKGIDSSSALINNGNSYRLPNLAVMSQNHVINYIPSLDIYLDSTAQFSPYGTLPFGDMDKPVILTTLNKIGHTPIPRAENNVVKANVVMKINRDETISGNSKSTVTGFYNQTVRSRELNSKDFDDKDRIDERLENGETGTGRINTSNPLEISKPFIEEATFTLDSISNFPGPGAMVIPFGIKLTNLNALIMQRPKDTLMFPSICASKTYEETYILTFPENTKITKLPSNVDYKSPNIQYNANYSVEGNSINVSRYFKSQHKSSLCADSFSEQRKEAVKVIQRDLRSQIFYD